MTHPEANLAPMLPLASATVENLLFFTYGNKLKYDEIDAEAILERARIGEEVEISVVEQSIWTPKCTPESEALRLSLDGGWSYTFEGWLWDHGQEFDSAVPRETLRDPETGRLANSTFIGALLSTGKAVELTSRHDEKYGEITVNNVWKLQRMAGGKGFLPYVRVDSTDAGINRHAQWNTPSKNGPSYLRVTRAVSVARKLIILPELELPQLPEQTK